MSQLRLFLGGDVMAGRGIDQVMHTPGDPTLHEPWVKSALEYVRLAEAKNGPIPRDVGPEYIWGDALAVLDEADAGARIVNLETAITDQGDPWPGKDIHYRMHPDNLDCISVAEIDCCVLANNHVLDWSYDGLTRTLRTLHQAGLGTVGAGQDLEEATRPATTDVSGRRVVVLALGDPSSGIPNSWSASANRPGVALAGSLSTEVEAISDRVRRECEPGDLVVVSIHWGSNWGYEIPGSHRRFARDLIDKAGVHVIHGHSSHHALGIEVYRGRPILYGCGDLINDYEGIHGHERYHPDLAVVYLLDMDSDTGRLVRLQLVPMQMRRFRLEHAPREEVAWLATVLTREGERLGTKVSQIGNRLELDW
jgi:poly-gamma-glutamate synthesis protein (capsule biosynthesis protein)